MPKDGDFPSAVTPARGFFLPEPDDPLQRYAASLVGVAFVERLAYDVLDRATGSKGGEVFITGGGSQGDVWMQCQADEYERLSERFHDELKNRGYL